MTVKWYSVAEWRTWYAQTVGFYNDIYGFQGHYDKTISFYNEFDTSKHTSFIGVFEGAKSIEFLQ